MKSLYIKYLVGLAGGAACATFAYVAIDSSATTELEHKGSESTRAVDRTAMVSQVADKAPSRLEREPVCAFRSGDTVSYSLKLAQSSTVDLSQTGMVRGAGASGSTSVRSKQNTRAVVDLEALEDTGDHTLLLARFREIDSSAVSKDAQLQAPFMLRLSRDCAVDGFAYYQNTPLGYARLQQGLAYELQWKWPQEKTEEFEGRNSVGAYAARVATRTQDEQTVIDRRVVSYEPWQHGIGSDMNVDDSIASIEPGGGPWFESFEMRERLRGANASLSLIHI